MMHSTNYKKKDIHKFIIEVSLWSLALPLAYILRLGGAISANLTSILLITVMVIPIKGAILYVLGLHVQSWHKVSIWDLFQIIKAVTILSLILFAATFFVQPWLFIPLSVPLIEAIIAIFMISSVRLCARLRHESKINLGVHQSKEPVKRVVIAGAGEAGTLLAREILRHPESNLQIIGFLDDNSFKKNQRFMGLPVFGGLGDLKKVVREMAVDKIFIAMPTAPGQVIRTVVEQAQEADVKYKVMPGLFDLVTEKFKISQIRDVNLEDLLRRKPVELDLEPIADYLVGRTVMVTGAGGSIGSEIVRQISRFHPKNILLLGRGENSIYEFERECRREYPDILFTSLIADVRDYDTLEYHFKNYYPNVIFHAAAHKHVPLMEANPDQAILNNVGGKRNLIVLALLLLFLLQITLWEEGPSVLKARSTGHPFPDEPSPGLKISEERGTESTSPGRQLSEERTAEAPASVYGYVHDKVSGTALTGANIYFPDNDRGTSTNTSGYYLLHRMTPGTHTIRVSYLNYVVYEKEFTVEEGEEIRLDINLSPTRFEMDEITVTPIRSRQEQRNIGRRNISMQQLGRNPGVFQDDVFRSIQLLPGVAAASDISSGLYIRGGSPDQTLIQLDRATVYNPNHFFGFFSTFNSDAIDDVQLYKGTYPAKYGGRLGSVVDINNRDGNCEQHAGAVSFGMLSSRALMEGPVNSNGTYMATFRRSTMEPLLHFLRGEVEGVPDQFHFYDMNARVTWTLNDRNRLSTSIFTGMNDVGLPFNEQAYFNFRYGNRTFNTSWTHTPGSDWLAVISVTGSQYVNYPSTDMGGSLFERNNRINEHTLSADVAWFPDSRHEWSAGIRTGRMSYVLSDMYNGVQTLEPSAQTWHSAVYVQNEWRPASQWRIRTGLRGEYYSGGDFLKIGPRFTADYYLTGQLRLQAGYGRYYQYLSLVTNPIFSGFDVWVMSGDRVPPSWSDQFALGSKYEFRDDWEMGLEAYYRTMNDLFELDPFLGDVAGFDYHELFRFGDGYAWGLEAMVERTEGRVTGFVGYTFGRTWRRFPGYNEGRFFPPRFDRTHDLTAVLKMKVTENWRFSSTFTYQTGQAYSRPLARSTLSGNPIQRGRMNNLIVGKVNASRMPDYHRLDLAAVRKGSFFGISTSELKLQIVNVYSRRNTWFYMYDFNRNPPAIQEMASLPVLPSVTYSIQI